MDPVLAESSEYLLTALTDQTFDPSDRPELILVTCRGPFDRTSGVYL